MPINIHAEEIWLNVAEPTWDPSEVSAAKMALAATCGEKIETLGVTDFKTKRKDTSGQKKSNELKDIKTALKVLQENNQMPLVLAGTEMLKGCPQAGFGIMKTNDDIVERINTLETALAGFMTKTDQYMDSNNKQLDSIALDRGARMPRPPLVNLAGPETPRTKKRRHEESAAFFPDQESSAMDQSSGPVGTSWSNIAAEGVNPLTNQQQLQIRNMQQLMDTSRQQQQQQQQQQQSKPAKKKNICFGTAKTSGTDASQIMLAADINLVASGLDMECTEDKLGQFLKEKGLNPVEIVMMKKPEATGTEERIW